MDFSSFSEENFDVKNWVNAALTQGRSTEESIEQHASTIVMKLQMLYLELSNSLEDASNQALITVPKSIREIEKIRKEGSELKKKIDWFNEHLSKVEANTVDSLKFIAELDKVKMRMEKVQNALKQAEKVSKLGDNIEAIFSSNNFQQIADRIFQMQLSLQVLKDVKEFSKEQRNLEKLQDRLEGMTRPYLLQAFNQHDVDAALQFVDIFTKINRTPQLLEYYYRCRQVPVEQHWTNFDKQQASQSAQSSPASPRKLELNFETMKENPFTKWLPSFYDEILMLTNKEVTWSQKVFSKEYQVIPSLIHQTLSSFTPQFKKRIETYILHENNKQFLEHLIALHSVTTSFSRTILGVIPNADPQMVFKVKSSIFEPYFQYQHDYPNLEKKFLTRELEKIKTTKAVFAKTISNIENSISKLFLAGEQAIERCLQFTQASESEGLVKTLNDFITEFIQNLFILLQSLREQAHLDTPSKDTSSQYRFDWSYFGGALSLLQIVFKLSQRLLAFDRLLRSHLVSQKATLFLKNGTEITVLAPHLRNHAEKSKRLIAFFNNLEDVTSKLLVAPGNLLNSYNQAVHSFVYDTVFVFVKEKLANVSTLETWVQEPQVSPLNLPTFSLSPSPYINQIGEHLLTLPQQLEPFANQSNSDSNSFDAQAFTVSPKTMEEMEGVEAYENPQKSETNEEEDENKFAFQWINLVGRGTVTLYLQKILDIPVLSELGTSQIIVDIGYLINVLSALGVSIDPDLEVVLKYLNAKNKSDFVGIPDSEQRIASILSQKRGIK